MPEDSKDTFPSVPSENWFALRRQFKKSIPTTPLTIPYLKSVLGDMTPESARGNVLRPLKVVGLLDDRDKPTPLATRWRDDNQYAEVCKEMLERIYPEEVRGLFSDPSAEPTAVRGWFASHTGKGQNAAYKMARFYLLLLQADPNPAKAGPSTKKVSAPKDKPVRTRGAAESKSRSSRSAAATVADDIRDDGSTDYDTILSTGRKHGLSLHIDINIHISPEAEPDQIDKIFESMAKHLPLSK